jgi:UrcA family protein
MNNSKAFGSMPVLLAIVCVVGLSATARASDPNNDVPRQVVKYADLNLDSAAGVSALYRRIEHAAIRVCGDPADTRELFQWSRLKACNARAVAQAVDAVNSGALTALHAAKVHPRAHPMMVAEVAAH